MSLGDLFRKLLSKNTASPAKTIRKQSLITAKALGYLTNPNLPLLEDLDFQKTTDQIISRTLSMSGVVLAAMVETGRDEAREAVSEWVSREFPDEQLTPSERAFLESGKGDRNRLQVMIEAEWILCWVLGIHDKIDFANYCGNELTSLVPHVPNPEPISEWRKKVRLRAKSEILPILDLAYCLHWSVKEAGLQGITLPVAVRSYVITQRRHALEWLFSDADWDDVSLDT